MKDKIILLTIMALITSSLKSQQSVTPPTMSQARAGMELFPEKSFQSFQQYAETGNPEAMNALGISYSKGLGTKVDEKAAAAWFRKAGEAGYAKAWNNLGIAYKNGLGVEQDFAEAYNCFDKSARGGSPLGYYSKGYMLFKGFGSTQDYTQAVEWFRRGADSGELGSTYMLGICLRNGYGVARNTDSARTLLEKAAAAGYAFAPEELATAEPENISDKPTQPIEDKGSQNIAIKKGMDSGSGIVGSYEGLLLHYDWSGKYLIGTSMLHLDMYIKDSLLLGTWQEDGQKALPIQAALVNDGLQFNNTSYYKKDHYSNGKQEEFKFVKALLGISAIADSVLLSGRLQYYLPNKLEPEKPVYVSLVRSKKNQENTKSAAENTGSTNIKQELSVSDIKIINVYPNPFRDNLNVSFVLEKGQKVRFSLFDIQGKLFFTKEITYGVGKQMATLTLPHLAPGSYILQFKHGNKIESKILVRQ